MSKSCFGAYDIRGGYPSKVNEKLAYGIGRVYPTLIKGKKIAVGRDVRLSGECLLEALIKGLMDAGAEVIDIGLCGTEMVYFTVPYMDLDGGIMITASHNPKEYNGMKFVERGSAPLSKNLFEGLERKVLDEDFPAMQGGGCHKEVDILPAYVEKMLSYVNYDSLKPYKVVVNAGNGTAGIVLEVLGKKVPFQFIKLGCNPDGNFPKGVPNPLLPENHAVTSEAVIKNGADFGVAWDGDFDRCFIYDEKGRFIDACYMVGFLAQSFLMKEKGAGIVYDPRAVFNIEDAVHNGGGKPIICKGGHVFFKKKMRETGAVYGGEMSAHHYFRDFNYCDSGMIPWLLLAELLSKSNQRLSELLDKRIKKFPVSGEKNLQVNDSVAALQRIEDIYGGKGQVSKVDGLSVDMGMWRFNLRASNTEPLLRLNVESRGNERLCFEKMDELLEILMGTSM